MGGDKSDADIELPLVHRLSHHRYRPVELVALDLIVVILLTLARAFVMPNQIPNLTGTAWPVAGWVAWIAASTVILFRRRFPALTLALVVVLVLTDITIRAKGGAAPFYLALSVYSFAIVSSRQRALIVTALVTGAELAGTLVGAGNEGVMASVGGAAVVLLGWLASENTRASRIYVRQVNERAVEQAAAASAAREEQISRAVTDERSQIARELHDIVAHGMSIIAVRAGVARMVLDAQPEEARAALAIIETTSRRSLQEMRLLVSVLRSTNETQAQLDPSPGLADLDPLISDIELAGVQVQLSVAGPVRDLPPTVELSAYRIVQEALTNVVRHAGPTRAEVNLHYRSDELIIEVRDDGPEPGHPREPALNQRSGGGHGLVGIRERAALFGGTVSAEAQGRGFRLCTNLRVNDFQPFETAVDDVTVGDR